MSIEQKIIADNLQALLDSKAPIGVMKDVIEDVAELSLNEKSQLIHALSDEALTRFVNILMNKILRGPCSTITVTVQGQEVTLPTECFSFGEPRHPDLTHVCIRRDVNAALLKQHGLKPGLGYRIVNFNQPLPPTPGL